MLSFLFVIFAIVGLAHILVDGSIMVPFKQKLATPKWQDKTWRMYPPFSWFFEKKEWNPYSTLLDMTNCYSCSGWWAGLFVSIAFDLYRWDVDLWWFFWIKYFLWAFAGSFLSNLGAVIIGFFNSASVK